jgi:hypothetical protein
MTPVSASTPRDLAALFICRLATCSRSKPTEIKGNSPNKAEARTVDAVDAEEVWWSWVRAPGEVKLELRVQDPKQLECRTPRKKSRII